MTTTYASFTVPPAPPPGPELGGPEAFPQTALQTFRDTVLRIVPRWLRGLVGGGVLYAIAAQLDLLTDVVRDGVYARFPGRSPQALPIIGRDRRIRRGLSESEAHYAARLPAWLDKHAHRGGPYALLEQVYEYFAPNGFQVELRYASGRRFQMDAAGSIVRDIVTWTPPGDSAKWARWWLTYWWPAVIESDGKWGDPGVWGDGGVWGANLTAADVRSIRLIPREWGTGHAFGYITLKSSPVGGIDITIGAETA